MYRVTVKIYVSSCDPNIVFKLKLSNVVKQNGY